MIERLEQLTVNQFVDLVCGDTSVLYGKREIVSETRLTLALRNIVFEYKEIADHAGAHSYIGTAEELIKARTAAIMFRMCHNLVNLGEHGRAREVLAEDGVNAESMTDQRMAAEVKSRLERARSTVAKIEDESHSESGKPADIRRMFDEQTASLMTHFKFQIDTSTMKASIYASLVARCNREIKAQIAAMGKR